MTMTIAQRIDSLIKLGDILKDDYSPEIEVVIHNSSIENPWFTTDNIRLSLDAIANSYLDKEALNTFAKRYH